VGNDASDDVEVTLEFSIPGEQEDRYRFDITVWDEFYGPSLEEALIARRTVHEQLSFDYSYLHHEMNSMVCQYRTASAFLGPIEDVPLELVTLVTQCSLDRLPRLREQALAFGNNPVSVAVYVPYPAQSKTEGSDDVLSSLRQFHAELAENGARRVTISLLFGNAPSSSDYDNMYPINSLRNVALDAATTELVFLVDVDYVPSRELALLASADASAASPYQAYREMCEHGDVLAVLAFEVQHDLRALPETRKDIEELWHRQGRWDSRAHVEVFHFTNFPNRHLPSNFERWFYAEEPYAVEYHGTRIEGYDSYARHISMFEPYAIASRARVPRYDERFRGYGFNKISHAHEWAAGGATFWVLPHVFMTAREHAPSDVMKRMWTDSTRNPEHEQRIALLWEVFLQQLHEKYHIECKGAARGEARAACSDDPAFDLGNGDCKSYRLGVLSGRGWHWGARGGGSVRAQRLHLNTSLLAFPHKSYATRITDRRERVGAINDFACQEDGACVPCCASCAHAAECQDTVSMT